MRNSRSVRRPLSSSFSRLGSVAKILSALALAAGTAKAAPYIWDPLHNLSGSGGAGTWDLATALWSDGAGSDVVWPNTGNDVAIFGGTGGLVTIDTALDAGVTVNGLTFNTTGYTIAGAIPSEVLSLGGGTATITVTNAADQATISAVVAGGSGLTVTGAGTLNLTAANTYTGLTTISGGTLKISDILGLGTSAAGTVVSSGGTLQLAATGTILNEALTLNGTGATGNGALVVDTSSTWTGGPISIATSATINVGTGATWTDNNAVGTTVTGNLTKTGNGTLQLTNGITLGTGTLTINGGVFAIDGAARWNSGAITINSGGILRTTGGSDSVGNTASITVNAGGAFDFQQGAAETVSQLFLNGTGVGGTGALTNSLAGSTSTLTGTNPTTLQSATSVGGAGNIVTSTQINAGGFRLTKVGSGNFTLNAANTSVGLTINGGQWITNTETALGNAPTPNPVADSIILDGGGITWTGGAITFNVNRGISIGTNGGSINNNTTNTIQFPQLIADVAGQSGALTLGGSAAGITAMMGQNTFSGGLIINGPTIFVPQASSTGPAGAPTSGPAGTGTITFNGGQIRATTGVAITLANNVNLAADLTIPTSGLALTFSGNTTLSGATRTVTDNSATDVTFSGAIGDGGNALGLTKAGTGRLVLSGASTYAGPTSLTAGTLSYASIANVGGGASALGAPTTAANGTISVGSGTTAVTLQYAGTLPSSSNRVLDFAGTTGAVTLDASGTIGAPVAFTSVPTYSGAGAKTITFAGSNTDENSIAALADVLPGTFATTVSKTGAGQWVLAGANTYTGTTTISGANGVLTLAGNNTGSPSAVTITAGSLRVFSTPNFTAGVTTLNGGILDLRNDASSTFAKDIVLGANSTINVDHLPGGAGFLETLTLQSVSQTSAAARTLNVTGGSGYGLTLQNLQLAPVGGNQTTTVNPTTANVTIQSVTNPMNAVGVADTLALGGTSPANFVTGVIPDTVGNTGFTKVAKTGTGTWTLSGANTYTGSTTITQGVLSIATLPNGGVAGPIGASTNALANLSLNGGTLQYTGTSTTTDRGATLAAASTIEITNPAATLEFTGQITGATSRVLTKAGNGTLTLSGVTDNTALWIGINAGTVILNKTAANMRISTINSTNAGTLLILQGNNGDQINGAVLSHNGTWDMNGRSEAITQFTGGSTGLVTNSVANTRSLLTVNGAASAFSGTLQDGPTGGILGLSVTGNALNLSGTNTYTGGTTITSGVLTYSSAASVAANGRNIVVSSGGTAAFDYVGVQDALNRTINGISAGAVGIGANSGSENIDLTPAGANLPLVSLGASTAGLHYSGTLTPANNVYRLGNTNQLQLDNVLADGPGGAVRSVVITGAINYQQSAANTYTGGTTLATGGVLNFKAGTLSTGDIAFTGNATLQWNSTNTSEDISLGRKVTLSAGTATFDTNGTGQTLSNSIGNGGAGAFVKAGNGNLTLAAANTFTGASSVTGGTLTLANTDALRNSTLTSTASVIFSSTAGGKFTLGGLTGSTGMVLQDDAAVPAPITLQVGMNNSAQSYTGVLSGAGGFTKVGSGTQTLTNANTYTGTTSIINGPTTSQQTVGTLKLDFSATGAVATNIIGATSALSFGGDVSTPATTILGSGTLNLTGKASTTNAQTFASTNLGAGGAGIVLTAAATNPLSLSLGTITRGRGATLDITQPTGTLTSTAPANGVLTPTGTASTLLSDANGTAYAVVGTTDWAAKDATNTFIVGLSSIAGGYTTFSGSGAIGGNADVTASGTATTGSTFNTVRFNTGTPTLTLAGVNTISGGGVLLGNGLGGNVTITGGSIQPGTGAELVFINDAVTTARTGTINSTIVNNGATPTNVTFRGNSSQATQFAVGGTNTYSGTTLITGSRVSTNAVASPFGTGDVYINGNTDGGYLKTGGTTTNHFYIVGNGWQETNGPFGAIRVDGGTLSGTITLLGDAALGAQGGGTGVISGTIEGGFNLTKLGTTALTLSGTNTYTGSTFINGGTLQFNSTGAIGGTGASVTVASGASVAFNYAFDQTSVNRLNPASAGTLALLTATSTNLDFSSLPSAFLGANAAVTYSGTLTPNGNTYRLGGGSNTLTLANTSQLTGNRNVITNGAVVMPVASEFTGSLTTLAGTATMQWGAGDTQDITATRTIILTGGAFAADIGANNVAFANPIANGGAGGFTKLGSGTLTVNAVNTYTGTTTVSAGTLLANVAGAVPSTGALVLNAAAGGATLQLGADISIGSLASTGTFAVGNGRVDLNGHTLTMGYNNAATNFYSAIIGSGNLLKLGTGTQTLTGNTTPANGLTYTGSTTIQGGALFLNFADGVAPATNILPTGTAFTLAGGALQMTGKNTTTNSQTFTNGVTLNPGGSGVTVTAGTTNPIVANLNGITRNTGSTVNFTNPSGTLSATNGITTTTLNADYTAAGGSQTILGGYATVSGNTWAVTSNTAGTNNVAGLATYTGFAAAANVDVPSSVTSAPGAITVNSMRFNTVGTATATIVDATGGLSVASGGILMTNTVGAFPVAINNGTLTSGNGQDLIVFQNDTSAAGTLTISSKITGSIGLTKSGGTTTTANTGLLNLTNGANDFTGPINVNGGTLQLSANGAAGAASNAITLNNGAMQLTLSGGITLPNAITINAGVGLTGVGAISSVSGNNVVSGPVTINASTIAGGHLGASSGSLSFTGPITSSVPIVVRVGNVSFSGGGNYASMQITQATASLGADNGIATNAVVDFGISGTSSLDLNGHNQTLAGLTKITAANAGTLTNSSTTPAILTLNVPAGASYSFANTTPGTITGNLSIVKNGAGSQLFGGPNTYTGSTTLNAGSLIAASSTAFGNTQSATNAFTVNGGTLDLNGIGNLTVGAFSGTGGTVTDNGTTAGTTTFSTASATNATFAGAFADGSVRSVALVKDGTGTLTLTGVNTFTGRTDVYGGTLAVNGSLSGTVSVRSGGTLGGSGTVGAISVFSGGVLAPGNSPGILTTNGAFNLSSGGAFNVEINSATPGTGYDQLNVNGTVTLAGNLNVSGGFLSGGSTLFLIKNDGTDPISGTFNGLAEGSHLFSGLGQEYILTYLADAGNNSFTNGNDVALQAVPEPGSALMLLGGLAVAAQARRRRKQ